MATIDRSKGKAVAEAKKARGIVRNQNKRVVNSDLESCQTAVHISNETIAYWQEQETAVKLGRMARVRKGAGCHSLFGSDRHFYREQDMSYH